VERGSGAPRRSLAPPGAQSRLSPVSPATAAASDFSRAAEADAHLAAFHHHRDAAIAVAEAQHLLQRPGIRHDIPVDDLQTLFALGLPGLEGKRSGLFAEDGDLLSHSYPPYWESRK